MEAFRIKEQNAGKRFIIRLEFHGANTPRIDDNTERPAVIEVHWDEYHFLFKNVNVPVPGPLCHSSDTLP